MIAQPNPLRRADLRRQFARDADGRLKLLLGAVLAGGALLLLRIVYLVAIGLVSPAQASSAVSTQRGDIVDRNNVVLASSIPKYSLRVVKTRLMNDPAMLARRLAVIFPDRDPAYFYNRLTMRAEAIAPDGASGAQIAALRGHLARYRQDGDVDAFTDALVALFPAGSAAAENADADEHRLMLRRRVLAHSSALLRANATPAQLNAVNDLAEIGFEYPVISDRLYPQGQLAAHVLGIVPPAAHGGYRMEKRDGIWVRREVPVGGMGIERQFDGRLTAPATRSRPLQLSLDSRVQASLELELNDAVEQLEAQGGSGIVLDVDTGEVIAMASNPSFDPNRVRFETDAAQWNSVSYTTFELGSTFKPLTVAAAMDAGVVTDLSRRYDASQPIRVDGQTLRDLHSSGRWMNVPEALVHSSNVVTAQIARELGTERLQAMFRALDFDKQPHVELQEVGRPRWVRPWGRVSTMTAGYGHSIAVTPLHLASAYAALVNGGIWRSATLLKVEPGRANPGRRVFSEATSASMRRMLRMIVKIGTGTRADAPGYRVGGKTGSAERPEGGGYSRNSVVATFAAAFPMDRPRYVVLVMIDRPPGNAYSLGQRTAGYTAAPVVRKVVQRIGPMLGIYPDADRDVDISELEPLLWKPRSER
jgi:cell division protein FtsI (penicillin-binding protein 3)